VAPKSLSLVWSSLAKEFSISTFHAIQCYASSSLQNLAARELPCRGNWEFLLGDSVHKLPFNLGLTTWASVIHGQLIEEDR
jgi:hypothetical protein